MPQAKAHLEVRPPLHVIPGSLALGLAKTALDPQTGSSHYRWPHLPPDYEEKASSVYSNYRREAMLCMHESGSGAMRRSTRRCRCCTRRSGF